jgi:hypothetical protein
MLYGEGIKEIDAAIADAALATAIVLEAALNTVVLLKTMNTPGFARAFGFRPTVTFNYATLTAKGVLTLYRYPAGVAGNKVALGTINLEDGDVALKEYFRKVSNTPALTVPPSQPPANYEAGDVLAIWVTTAATGGGGIAGDYQPLMWVSDRGENIPNQGQLVDRTP